MKTKLTLLAFLILSFLTKAQEEYYAVNYRYASPEYSATFDGVDDCIETGVLMGPDIKIEMKVEVSSYEAFDKFFNTSNPPFFGIGVRNNGGEKIYGLADNSTYDIVDLVLDSAIVITFDANKGYFGVGNNRVPFTPRSVSSGDPLIIGGSSVFSQFSNIEFYYCKVWKQGRLIRYFLPQVDGTIKDIKNDVTYENTEMGNELVINGQFTYPKDSGDWQGIDWTWDGIRMVNGGGNDWLWQVGTLPTNNTEYLVSFDINQTNEVGAIGAYRGIGAQVIEQNITSGSHSYNFHAGVAYFPSDNFLGFKTNTGWLGTVDNVSVIPIGRTTFPVTRLDGENLYYVATDGNDGGTGAINDPFATIQHAFDVSSAGQTIVLFGGVYNEVLNFANKGGSPGSSILIRAYAGEKPILSGFYTVTDFTSNGNIHTSTGAVTTLNSANVILYNNNVLTHPAREPNEGYWRIGDSVYQNQHFVSEQAFGYTPSEHTWVDLKDRKYSIARGNAPISIVDSTVYATATAWYTPLFGYFFANDSNALDVEGETFFNPDTKKLSIYSSTVPDSVKIPIAESVLTLVNAHYITLDGLTFEGGNTYGINHQRSKNIIVQNCEFRHLFTAIDIRNHQNGTDASENCAYVNNYFHDINNMSMDFLQEARGHLIEKNLFVNNSLVPGLGWPKNAQYSTIRLNGDNCIIRDNVFKKGGYHAISFGGANTKVYNNYIERACLLMDDGAGIYTGGGNIPGREITDNVILYTYGNAEGSWQVNPQTGEIVLSGRAAESIYLDENANDIYVARNVVISHLDTDSMTRDGIKMHKGEGHLIEDNIFWGCQWGISAESYSDVDLLDNITVDNNLFVIPKNSLAMFWTSKVDNRSDFGLMSNNKYVHWVENGDSIFKSDHWISGGYTYYQSQPTFDYDLGYSTNTTATYGDYDQLEIYYNASDTAAFYTALDTMLNLKEDLSYDSGQTVQIPEWYALPLKEFKGEEVITYGPEILVNPSFDDTLAPWYNSGTTDWVWAPHQANIDATAASGALNQDNVFEDTTQYKFEIEVEGSGGLLVYRGGGIQLISQITSAGFYQLDFTSNDNIGASDNLMILAQTGFNGNINNLSLKKVNPVIIPEPVDTNTYGDERILNGTFDSDLANWTLGGTTAWTWASDSTATIDASAASGNMEQDNIFTDSADWRISFDLEISSGAFQVYRGQGIDLIGGYTVPGSYSFDYSTLDIGTADHFRVNATTGSVLSVDNISVRELNPTPEPAPVDTNTYGPELLLNNTFLTDLSDWTTSGAETFTFSNGGAYVSADNGSAQIYQDGIFADSTLYRVGVQVTGEQGSILVYRGIGNDSITTGTDGWIYTDYFSGDVSTYPEFLISAGTGFVGTIDSASVREINPMPVLSYDTILAGPELLTNYSFNDGGTGWTTGGTTSFTFDSSDSTANIDATGGSGRIEQAGIFSDSTEYIIQANIDITAGSAELYRGTGIENLGRFETDGYNSTIYTSPAVGVTTGFMFNGNNLSILKVHDVSIKEHYASGTNLIQNDTTGWVNDYETFGNSGRTEISYVDGNLRVTNTVSPYFGYAAKELTTIPGVNYQITISSNLGTALDYYVIVRSATNTVIYDATVALTDTLFQFEFTATTDKSILILGTHSNTTGTYIDYDAVIFTPMLGPDLIANGTLDDDTDWSYNPTNFTFSDGVCYVNSPYAETYYTAYTLDTTKTYLLEFDCVSNTGSRFLWKSDSGYRLANGRYQNVINPPIQEELKLKMDITGTEPDGTDYFDNVRLREIYPIN